MKYKKSYIFIAFILIISCFLLLNYQPSPHKDNQSQNNLYIIESEGYNGTIKLAVRFDKNKIQSVEVLSHNESPGVSDPAINDLTQDIVKHQSIGIDVKSGVTISSNAILNGVKEAIIKAGLNLNHFQTKPVISNKKETITLHTDVVVIGSGGAGCAAAATVVEEGGNVIIVEKMPYYGGNTNQAAGTMNAVDPIRQKRQNITDSNELFIKQTYEYGGKKGNLKLIETLVNHSLDARNWLSSYGGKWSEKIYQTIGGIWPRSMDVETYGQTKQMYLDPLLKKVLSHPQNQLLLNLKATSLIEKDGIIVGINAQSQTDFKEYHIYAKNGVIIATGGYSANLSMIKSFNSNIPLNTSNHLGATGDGILLAQQVDAALVGMESIQMHPHGNPQTGQLQSEIAGDVTNSIYINMQGKRFVNEQATWQEISQAVLNQPNKIMYSIFDSTQTTPQLDSAIRDYRLIKAQTINELAQKLGINPRELTNTIQDYNNRIENSLKDPFHKLTDKPVLQAPFYACLLTPVYHYTMGGIQINEKAQVINVKNEIIPHLYAAGEVTGGIHGDNRLGGNSMTDIVVFGRIAGKEIMKK